MEKNDKVKKEPSLHPEKSELKQEEEREETCSKKEYDDLFDKHLRLKAEFDNFRKRVEKEKKEFRIFANEKIVFDLLTVMDHLELALKHSRGSRSVKALAEGVGLVLRQFRTVLGKYGLKPIDALGKPFDPQYHDAFMQVESEEHDDSTIVEEFQKGYILADKILRPAKVSVSKKTIMETADSDE